MKEIIINGKKEFTIMCPKCGCVFKYTLDDISLLSWAVICPECNTHCQHPNQVKRELKEKDNGKTN